MHQIYLDTCCYNRPFDDLSHDKIKNEATAKMYIQALVKYKSLALCSSYILLFEVGESPIENSKEHILRFVYDYSEFHVGRRKKMKRYPLQMKLCEKELSGKMPRI